MVLVSLLVFKFTARTFEAWLPVSLLAPACFHADFAFTDIGRELGRLWSELPEKDRKVRKHARQIPSRCPHLPWSCVQPFQAKADADKARYAKEVAASA